MAGLEVQHALFDGVIAVFTPDHQPTVSPIPERIDGLRAVVVYSGHQQKKNTGRTGRQARQGVRSLRGMGLGRQVKAEGFHD
jgi:hypothetical protein